jgi:hypothetical protein
MTFLFNSFSSFSEMFRFFDWKKKGDDKKKMPSAIFGTFLQLSTWHSFSQYNSGVRFVSHAMINIYWLTL